MARNNHVEITGNMGAEARISNTKTGKMASVSIATTESYKKDGEYKDKETVWHSVLVFNSKGIEAIEHLEKGTRLKISGELSYRDFKTITENGQEITKQECAIIANDIEPAPLPSKEA